jgi:glycosyltransferase involved in cell wall biosynthesis
LSISRQSELYKETKALGLPGFDVDTYTRLALALGSLPRLFDARRKLGAYLRDHHIQAVDCTMGHVWNPAVLGVIKKQRIPYIFTLHDAVLHSGDNFLLRAFMVRREVAQADRLIVLSDHVRRQAEMAFKFPAEQISVIPHGVFNWGESKPRVFPKGRPFRLLFFGRIQPYKGLHLLLEAFSILKRNFSEIELLIAGPGNIVPYQKRLSQDGIIVSNRWIPEDEVFSILSGGDLMVLPHVEASQSGVVASAYGAALPVVANAIGGITEQVLHGKSGLLTKAPTAKALAEAISLFLSDRDLYESCSREALAIAESTLSWQAIGNLTAESIVSTIRTING